MDDKKIPNIDPADIYVLGSHYSIEFELPDGSSARLSNKTKEALVDAAHALYRSKLNSLSKNDAE